MSHPDDLTRASGASDKTPFPEANLKDLPPEVLRASRARAARNDIALRRRVAQKLTLALANGDFVLHYQPKVHLRSGEMRGAEALLRLKHRRRGLIPAAHFMPAAEESEIVNEIGAWALTAACREAARWPARFIVSLDVSHRQLRSGRLAKQVIEALAAADLAADRLELELSEAMLIDDNEETGFGVKAARALGVGIALDDFGAGYASLNTLKRVPLTTLKLDRAVISGLDHDRDAAAILRAAIEAAHALGCAVVADGVETAAQVRVLYELGCDQAQGSFFCPALPPAELLARFERG